MKKKLLTTIGIVLVTWPFVVLLARALFEIVRAVMDFNQRVGMASALLAYAIPLSIFLGCFLLSLTERRSDKE